MKINGQKGVTLVELLAVLSLASIFFALIFGIWLSGAKSSESTMTQNDLQADAHLVQAALTNAFYHKNDKPFTVVVNEGGNGLVKINYLNPDSEDMEVTSTAVISGHNMSYSGSVNGDRDPVERIDSGTAMLNINLSVSHGDHVVRIQTTLNYPWNENDGGENE